MAYVSDASHILDSYTVSNLRAGRTSLCCGPQLSRAFLVRLLAMLRNRKQNAATYFRLPQDRPMIAAFCEMLDAFARPDQLCKIGAFLAATDLHPF